MPAGDPLSYAVEAEKNLEALATELARLGADPGTVKAVTQMAEVCRKIVKALGKGQHATADNQPAAPAQSPAPAPQQPQTIGQATDQLHQAQQQRA